MSDIAAITEKLAPQPEVAYPKTLFYEGPEAPCRFEGEVYNCIVKGTIPTEVQGTYYRCMPDALWAPKYQDDVFINGDGAIDAIRIKDGHVDFKQKYVRTSKFVIERAARQAVFGKYRNRYTDDPRVKHEIHSTANTHIIYFEKQLLALKEDSPPYAIDPHTLETKGPYTFNGQYTAPTFTAHPKIDPTNGEMLTMGYEAKGDGTTDVSYYLFSKEGKKLEECWFNAPHVGMMHDMAATENWVVFIVPPLEAQPIDEMKKGSKHFAWAEEKSLTFGILPRRNPKPEDIRWFTYKNAFYGHTGNAFDGEDGCVYLDAPLTNFNKFWFFPPRGQDPMEAPSGKPPASGNVSQYVRWKYDPNATDFHVEPTLLVDADGEMPKVDDRYVGKPYNTLFYAMHDPTKRNGPVGGVYNAIAKCNVATGELILWSAGDHTAIHEVAFIPRNPESAEADGYLITLANRRDTGLSCILILDARKVPEGPVEVIELPFRLRNGIHGSWVSATELDNAIDLCDMSGVTEKIRQEFGTKEVTFPVL
ncbi:Carotenoid oxygenase [Penicillium daleae]|uniref:Carotenoid oxygenase n=1 Tax=Penicillium daleae TaxID=63821 RepID=A0AAD6BX99_9EURO|nr:Carotenoid oxygenase [Penicillium daleae]KAJ5438090.1 Carotenoid oxygenase [Penicillium daleae]